MFSVFVVIRFPDDTDILILHNGYSLRYSAIVLVRLPTIFTDCKRDAPWQNLQQARERKHFAHSDALKACIYAYKEMRYLLSSVFLAAAIARCVSLQG